jgi:hypothetical protein
MKLFGIDLNANRARAVAGPADDFPRPVALEPPHAELPLAVSLERPRPAVGAAGLRLCRRAPHLARTGFLAEMAGPTGSPTDLLALFLKRLSAVCKGSDGAVFALPAYLTTEQVGVLFALAAEAALPLPGCVASPLALALSAHAERGWSGTAAVVDVDDHALTVAAVTAADGHASLREARGFLRLGLRYWRQRLLDGVAERCIRQSRRDPRDSPQAEQALFNQLDEVFDACRQGRAVHVALETARWYQNVAVQPSDACAVCAPLTRQAVAEVAELLAADSGDGPTDAVLLSASAARLPGLVTALQAYVDERHAPPGTAPLPDVEDFGEGLLEEEGGVALVVLPPDAAARAAHGLAAQFQRGDLLPGHLDAAAPLPLPLPAEAGPARLHYLGEEYLLDRPSFTLGRQLTCDLTFDGDAYPMVAPRHCEINDSGDGYAVRDRSRGETFVNDEAVEQSAVLQPGDALRLGNGGPVLRFLGHPAERRALTGA